MSVSSWINKNPARSSGSHDKTILSKIHILGKPYPLGATGGPEFGATGGHSRDLGERIPRRKLESIKSNYWPTTIIPGKPLSGSS